MLFNCFIIISIIVHSMQFCQETYNIVKSDNSVLLLDCRPFFIEYYGFMSDINIVDATHGLDFCKSGSALFESF